jgi:hypothetical protein
MAFFMKPDYPVFPDNTPIYTAQKADDSRWGGINKNLLAQIYVVDKLGNKKGDYVVEAAITEGNIELASQYSSPFDANPDQRMPTLMGMVQSGEAVSSLGNLANSALASNGFFGFAANALKKGTEAVGFDTVLKSVSNAIQSVEGKTNLTKVNSTLIFNSTQGVKLSLTLHLRAWEDAKKEVEEPISWLERWSLPAELSKDGILVNVGNSVKEKGAGIEGVFGGLFPSTVPPFIAITYAGRTYLPFLIESISTPLVVERDSDMNRLAVTVTITIVSRTAWDATDIKKLYGY